MGFSSSNIDKANAALVAKRQASSVLPATKRTSLDLDQFAACSLAVRHKSLSLSRAPANFGRMPANKENRLSLAPPSAMGVTVAMTKKDGKRRDLHMASKSSTERAKHVVVNAEPIAEGGQSLIYAAVDVDTGAPLVFKKLKSKDLEKAINEALTEANIAKDVDSSVTPVAVVHQPDGVGILSRAMRTNMRACINERSEWGWPKRRTLALNGLYHVLKSVQNAHSKGRLHCDIKAENIYFDAERIWVLGDWGYAMHESDTAVARIARGTMSFWPPELFDQESWVTGQSYSRAGDVWAVGLVYLDMLAGRPVLASDRASGFSLAQRLQSFFGQEQNDLENSPFLDDNDAFAQAYKHLSGPERELLAMMLDPNPKTRGTAPQLLEKLEKRPLAHYVHKDGKAREEWRADSFANAHGEKMRAVLDKDELARSEPLTPRSGAVPNVVARAADVPSGAVQSVDARAANVPRTPEPTVTPGLSPFATASFPGAIKAF